MPLYKIHFNQEWTEEVTADAWFPHGDVIEFYDVERFGIPNKNQSMNRTVFIVNTREIQYVTVEYEELEKVTYINVQ